MKILVPGDLSRLRKFRKFECKKCGCEFVAERNTDYFESLDMRNQEYATVQCPCCAYHIYEYKDVYKYCTEDGEPID